MKIAERIHLIGSEQFGLSHPFDCNAYLIDAGSELVVIDPGRGLDFDALERNIRADGFDPERISVVIATHSHDGHTGACAEFRTRFGCELWVPQGSQDMLADGSDPGIPGNMAIGMYPDGWTFPCFEAQRVLDDGERLSFGDLVLETISVRGHTPDSMCFRLDVAGTCYLFSGDTVFHLGRIGIVNLPGCSLDDYRQDIGKLAGLGVDGLLPAHGVFTVARGQSHIDRAIAGLASSALPPSFFESLEFASVMEAAGAGRR